MLCTDTCTNSSRTCRNSHNPVLCLSQTRLTYYETFNKNHSCPLLPQTKNIPLSSALSAPRSPRKRKPHAADLLPDKTKNSVFSLLVAQETKTKRASSGTPRNKKTKLSNPRKRKRSDLTPASSTKKHIPPNQSKVIERWFSFPCHPFSPRCDAMTCVR